MIGTDRSIAIKGDRWYVRGEPQGILIGVSSFKTPAWVAGDWAQNDQGNLETVTSKGRDKSLDWINYVQRMLDREHAVFRVFMTTEDWDPVPESSGLFGSPPRDPGIWDASALKVMAREGIRPVEVPILGQNVIEWLFRTSQQTRCIFELVVDATLKHTSGLTTGIIDQVIRQTAAFCRLMHQKYPYACVLFNSRNEWNAHNQHDTTLRDVNMWAVRGYRWKHVHKTLKDENGNPLDETELSFTEPKNDPNYYDWFAEQWPEGIWIVDGGGSDEFKYNVGPGPGVYKAGLIHPVRTGREWWQLPNMDALRRNANGMPIGANESMFAVDPKKWERGDYDGWFRNPSGLTSDLGKWMDMHNNFISRFNYDIFHYLEAVQADSDRPSAEVEDLIREYFGTVGDAQPRPNNPGSEEGQEDEGWKRYLPVIERLYKLVFGPERELDEGAVGYAKALRDSIESNDDSGLNFLEIIVELLNSNEFQEK